MEKKAFLFSGQGAQIPGMMKDLCKQDRGSREVFRIADEVLGRSISELAFEGSLEELNLTHNTQPCVLAADLAAWKALLSYDIKPDAAAGFSLGEYAALVAAGSLEMEDAFRIIQKRADFMQEAVPFGKGAMAAVSAKSVQKVQELCGRAEGYVIPANLNCPGQTVISGETNAVNRVMELARAENIKAMVLPVSAPFHCRMLKPAADKLAEVLKRVNFKSPEIPVYMNVNGKPEPDREKIAEKLVLQAWSPVYWEETLRNMYEDGVRIFIELGPGKTLSGFVKKTFKGYPDVRSFRVSDAVTLSETAEKVRGSAIMNKETEE